MNIYIYNIIFLFKNLKNNAVYYSVLIVTITFLDFVLISHLLKLLHM